jgi:hypothetical protein
MELKQDSNTYNEYNATELKNRLIATLTRLLKLGIIKNHAAIFQQNANPHFFGENGTLNALKQLNVEKLQDNHKNIEKDALSKELSKIASLSKAFELITQELQDKMEQDYKFKININHQGEVDVTSTLKAENEAQIPDIINSPEECASINQLVAVLNTTANILEYIEKHITSKKLDDEEKTQFNNNLINLNAEIAKLPNNGNKYLLFIGAVIFMTCILPLIYLNIAFLFGYISFGAMYPPILFIIGAFLGSFLSYFGKNTSVSSVFNQDISEFNIALSDFPNIHTLFKTSANTENQNDDTKDENTNTAKLS